MRAGKRTLHCAHHAQVPLECNFSREAEGMQVVRSALKRRAAQLPCLQQVRGAAGGVCCGGRCSQEGW